MDSKRSRLAKLKTKSADPELWADSGKASTILKQISRLEKDIQLWDDLHRRRDDLEVLIEFAEAGEVELAEVSSELAAFQKIIEDVELKLMLGGEQDAADALLTIHPGAGGTESQDWAEMLYRMYTRWIEK
ncbi:MAG: PCRF domain-containing protein, partial [Fidelibacterota bacterium]